MTTLPDQDRVLSRHRVTLTFDLPIRDITWPVVDAANNLTSNYDEYREEPWFLEGAAQERALLHAILAEPDTHAALVDILARQLLTQGGDILAGSQVRNLDAQERQLILDAAARMPDGAGQRFLDAEKQGVFSENTDMLTEATRSIENVTLHIEALSV